MFLKPDNARHVKCVPDLPVPTTKIASIMSALYCNLGAMQCGRSCTHEPVKTDVQGIENAEWSSLTDIRQTTTIRFCSALIRTLIKKANQVLYDRQFSMSFSCPFKEKGHPTGRPLPIRYVWKLNASRTGTNDVLCAYRISYVPQHGCRGSGSQRLSVGRARRVHKAGEPSKSRASRHRPDRSDRHL